VALPPPPTRPAPHPRLEAVLAVLLVEAVELLLAHQLTLLQRGGLGIDDDVALAVEDLLQVLEGDVEEVPDPAGKALQEPDVGHRGGEGDVPQPLAADLGLDDLHPALLADHPAGLHALVLAAVALVVPHR